MVFVSRNCFEPDPISFRLRGLDTRSFFSRCITLQGWKAHRGHLLRALPLNLASAMATNDWQISIQLRDDKQVVIERTYGSTDRY